MQELAAIQAFTQREPISQHSGVLSEKACWQDQAVFVKTLQVDDPEAHARFAHEGKVAASLHHPLIVSPVAQSPTQLIFPYIEGCTLRERLERGSMDVDAATDVALGLLRAVTYMHAQGVTHHDLKPENVVMADCRASGAAVRVIDFGMSHSTQLPLDIHSGTRMGTPHFMAPEQFRGRRGDPRSDLYSVGVLLFDCLAGHPPFEDALGWLAGIHDRRAELPGPGALHPLLHSSLSRDPVQRPRSAAEMFKALLTARSELGLPDLTDSASGAADVAPGIPIPPHSTYGSGS